MNAARMMALAAMLFLMPFHSGAWGRTGHRIIGGIAELYLSPRAKEKVAFLLGNESMAMAAGWADFIRSESTYHYLSPWHYINIPGGMNQERLMAYLATDRSTDLYTKLKYLIAELKKKSVPRERQVLNLKLLIHFIGDAHQPMHTAHPDDRGGNELKISWFNTPGNMHRLWDEQLIDYQHRSYTEYIRWINHPGAQAILSWQKQPLEDWFWENYRISEKLYAEVRRNNKLGYAYIHEHIPVLNSQLLKGGVRLAGVLNDIFK